MVDCYSVSCSVLVCYGVDYNGRGQLFSALKSIQTSDQQRFSPSFSSSSWYSSSSSCYYFFSLLRSLLSMKLLMCVKLCAFVMSCVKARMPCRWFVANVNRFEYLDSICDHRGSILCQHFGFLVDFFSFNAGNYTQKSQC